MPNRLTIGTKYSTDELEDIFDFEYKGRAGIKKAASGDIVLFSNNKGKSGGYNDFCDDGVFNYEGQNTKKGSRDQELKYGNRDLYDIYQNDNNKNIYVFRDYVYVGEYIIDSEPFKENGSWRFPLLKK